MKTKHTILIVDDEELILRGWHHTLDSAGYKVNTALSGKEAIELAKKEKPAVVITDLIMPEMDGVEICRRIKAIYPETEIVLVSGHPEEIKKSHRAFMQAGGRDEFLRKPLFSEELIEAVEKLLGKRSY